MQIIMQIIHQLLDLIMLGFLYFLHILYNQILKY